MSNVLDEEKQQQIVALGCLGWSLRRIEACAVKPSAATCEPRASACVGAADQANGRQNRPLPAGVHRPCIAKAGHFAWGVHRLGRPGADARAQRQRV